MKQLDLLKPGSKSYGGDLLKKRKGRKTGRPVSVKHSMHLVLKSSKAKGEWSFRNKMNAQKIENIVKKFSEKYSVRINSLANVGNHLHFHIQLLMRGSYKPFIRAITSAIAMAITCASRWNKLGIKFWDYRPFTTLVQSFRQLLNLKDYMMINQLEGIGHSRIEARFIVASRGTKVFK
jgi:REP element-mobilizing transposase RayT